MKERIEALFNKLQEAHEELTQLAIETESSKIWDAEGSMQDVKAHLREAYNNLNKSTDETES